MEYASRQDFERLYDALSRAITRSRAPAKIDARGLERWVAVVFDRAPRWEQVHEIVSAGRDAGAVVVGTSLTPGIHFRPGNFEDNFGADPMRSLKRRVMRAQRKGHKPPEFDPSARDKAMEEYLSTIEPGSMEEDLRKKMSDDDVDDVIVTEEAMGALDDFR